MKPGIDHLIEENPAWLRGKKIGVVVHPASRTANGTGSPDALIEKLDLSLSALFGPEHGVEGTAGAGVEIKHGHHTRFDCPVWSLYGDTRKPTPEMLENLDILIYDLQDISVRCYTYVSTLRLIMEACQKAGVTLVVTDRPTPFQGITDGPILDPAFRTFVGDFPGPLVYGLSSGQAAKHLKEPFAPELDLIVIPFSDDETIMPWIAPSPAITSSHAALCYPATVWVEALTGIDAHRSGKRPFQELSAEWLNAHDLVEKLQRHTIQGVEISAQNESKICLKVTNPADHRPVETGIYIISELQIQRGIKPFWEGETVRLDWFDKLMGTDSVRLMLQKGADPEHIVSVWQPGLLDYAESTLSL